MYKIDPPDVSEDFANCYETAGHHLQSRLLACESRGEGWWGWIKANLNSPSLEHFSFRVGNQLFFVRVIDVDEKIAIPGNPDGYKIIAKKCNGHACLLPMRNVSPSLGSKIVEWKAEGQGWGLVNPDTREPVDPLALVSTEKIEMTDWEVHDFAVQVVRDYVTEKLGHELMVFQGDPNVNPSIWFVGDDGPEWVVVRFARYPEEEAAPPDNLANIIADCSKLGKRGHFASVCFANAEDPFDPINKNSALPLWRGHPSHTKFDGIHLLWEK